MATPLPPEEIEGFSLVRPRNAALVTSWYIGGFRHGTRRGPALSRVYSAVMLAGYIGFYPAAVLEQWIRLSSRRARYYLSRQHDAVLGISAGRDGWRITAHASARPGTGSGAAMRRALLPRLTSVADEQGVTIFATAATGRLAEDYMAEIPDLREVGRGLPRGRRLRRYPRY